MRPTMGSCSMTRYLPMGVGVAPRPSSQERIRECFARYVRELEHLDWEAKEALLSLLHVKVIGSRERVLVLAEIDASVFTIEHTSASPRVRSGRSRRGGRRRGWTSW